MVKKAKEEFNVVKKELFGTLKDGRPVFSYTICSGAGAGVRFCEWGATLLSLWAPDKMGVLRDVVLGYDTLEEYLANGDYLGATVGRFANRIAHGRFSLGGQEYTLPLNDGKHSLHGGVGLSSKLWQGRVEGEDSVLFTCQSPHGEDGYGGNLLVELRVSFRENALTLDYVAKTDRQTVVNLTNHAYFNLHGGEKTCLSHKLRLSAEAYTRTDQELIPVEDVPVAGTIYDFRVARPIETPVYDNNFLLSGPGPQATLAEEETGIVLDVFTDCPGVQVYTSGMLTDRRGKDGRIYKKGQGICLETQQPPNAPNRFTEGGFLVSPEEPWHSQTTYRLSAIK